MFNDKQAIKNIRQKLFNISSNLHFNAYLMTQEKHKKRITSYTPTAEAREAQEMYLLSLQSDEWDRETENSIKAFIHLKRMYEDNLLMDSKEYARLKMQKAI